MIFLVPCQWWDGWSFKLVYEILHSPVTWTNWLSGWNDSNLCYELDPHPASPSLVWSTECIISQSQEISTFTRFWTLTSKFRTITIEFNSFTPSAYVFAKNTGLGKQNRVNHYSPIPVSVFIVIQEDKWYFFYPADINLLLLRSLLIYALIFPLPVVIVHPCTFPCGPCALPFRTTVHPVAVSLPLSHNAPNTVQKHSKMECWTRNSITHVLQRCWFLGELSLALCPNPFLTWKANICVSGTS